MVAKALRMQGLLRLFLGLQLDSWMGLQAIDTKLRFTAISGSGREGASRVHGRGLFAARPLSAGEIAAFYPVRALGDSSRQFEDDGSRDGLYGGSGHKPYRVALPSSPGLLAWDGNDLWVDTDPDGQLIEGWLGHLTNDACVCSEPSEEGILAYYACASGANACARLVSFGDTPLLCLVVTRDVASGEEILGSYGHDYWCAAQTGNVPPYTAAVAAAEEAWQAEGSSWRKRVQKEYAREIAAVSGLVEVMYEGCG